MIKTGLKASIKFQYKQRLVKRATYGCFLNGGENSSGFNDIGCSSISPLDVGWVSPAREKSCISM